MRRPKNVLIDNVAIRRRLAGEHQIPLTREERRRAIRILHRQGLNDREIARTAGLGVDAVHKVRTRLGLPANPVISTHAAYGLRSNHQRKAVA